MDIEVALDHCALDPAREIEGPARPHWRSGGNLSLRDLECLTPEELDDTQFEPSPTQHLIRRESNPLFPLLADSGVEQTYLDITMQPVIVDPALPGLELRISNLDRPHPCAEVSQAKHHQSRTPTYFFEFDTIETFDSPNLWRYPALSTYTSSVNCTSTKAHPLLTYQTVDRRNDGSSRCVIFPFRSLAMRLDSNRNRLTFHDLEIQAQALAWGLDTNAAVREIFNYVHYVYLRAHDAIHRPPLDVFRTGLGGCGHLNGLFCLLLELVGIRSRGVAGFDPSLRADLPGSGHSGVEIFRPDFWKWIYADPFFDFLSEKSAAELPDDAAAKAFLASVFVHPRAPGILSALRLAGLFKYRLYFDYAEREVPVGMFRLRDAEDTYGRDWPLITPQQRFEPWRDLPAQQPLFVRARYILSNGLLSRDLPAQSLPALASSWTVVRGELRPRDMLLRHPS